MEIITGLNAESVIDEEALLSTLLKGKTTPKAFRLDCTEAQAYKLLGVAYKAEVISRGRDFILTDKLKQQLHTIAAWMTGGHDTFGLFLCGRSGNGKSTMLRAINSAIGLFVPKMNYGSVRHAVVNARDVVRWAKAYANQDDCNETQCYMDCKSYEVLAIDDVGTEPTDAMLYGERIPAVTDLIYHRYDKMLTTFISSNLAASDMAGVYDGRVADRLREMMTIVDFGNEPSFRGGVQ